MTNAQFEEVLMLELKQKESTGGIIPSLNFSQDAYQQFLSHATPYELENDILTKETVVKIANINTYGSYIPYEPECEPKVDQELEACCEWFANEGYGTAPDRIRNHRRPKTPSLKEKALKSLERMQDQYPHLGNTKTIRRALEALPND